MTDDNGWDADKVRVALSRDLRKIGDLVYDLHAQALDSPNARDFPGGTALHMLGPAATTQGWERQYARKETLERFDPVTGADRWEGPVSPITGQPTSNAQDPAIYQSEDDAARHPLNVIESWTSKIREDRDQPVRMHPTLSSELEYLKASLDWCCRTTDAGKPAWPLVNSMRTELRSLVSSMESVIHDGPQIDRGVGCLKCGKELLKIWGIDPGTDRYVCTSDECDGRYDLDEYADAVERSYLLNAEWLTPGQIAAAWRIPIGSVLSWAHRGHVRKKKHPEFNRLVYNVADAKARRDREAATQAETEGA